MPKQFCPGRTTTGQISLFSKFSRNLASRPKISAHVLSTSRKHATGFLLKTFGECCGSTVLTAAFKWPPNHCIPAQKFVSVSEELYHDRSLWVLGRAVSAHSIPPNWGATLSRATRGPTFSPVTT